MLKRLRFLLATTAVLALAPVSSALAEHCDNVCSCSTTCNTGCTNDQGLWTTCGRGWDCRGTCFQADPRASVTQDEAPRDDTSALVCSEEHRDVELPDSAEG